jgi:cephalosporin hydroxylase
MQTFMGEGMAQNWQDLLIWEQFFNEEPVRTFIELGTGHGGMSLFFALQCHQRGVKFWTFDNQRYMHFERGLSSLLNMSEAFHCVDILTDDGPTPGLGIVRNVIATSERPLAIFFDNGDKPREWRTFASQTIPGDYLIVHDWDTEFHAGDIGDTPVMRLLEGPSDARGDGWKSMWFRRV